MCLAEANALDCTGWEQDHLTWLALVCGCKLFQNFWLGFWIMDYFISALHNPLAESFFLSGAGVSFEGFSTD